MIEKLDKMLRNEHFTRRFDDEPGLTSIEFQLEVFLTESALTQS